MITRVELTRRALKQLRRAPNHVSAKLLAWMDEVHESGLEEARKIPGYNDHPLKGALEGKRAIRLSRQWRAVYEIQVLESGAVKVEFVEVQEVHPHDY